MKKIIVITSTLFLCVIVAAVFYFSNLSVKNRTNDKVLAQMPGESTLIFQFRNDKSFSEIFKGYELFGAVLGKQRVAEIIQINELLLKQPLFHEAIDGQDIFLSVQPGKKDSTELLWALSLNSKSSSEEINDLLMQSPAELKATTTAILKQPVIALAIKPLNKVLYVFSANNLLFGSFSKKLMERFLDKSTPRLSKSFIAEINATEKKNSDSPFNLYINHNAAFPFVSKFLRSKADGNFGLLNQLGGSSVLNMNFKSDALMFSGTGTTDTTMNNYLNTFLYQKPIPVAIKNIFRPTLLIISPLDCRTIKHFNRGFEIFMTNGKNVRGYRRRSTG